MILIINFISFFTVSVYLVYGQSSCQTREGGNGECISILKCPSMLELVNNKNRTAQETELLKNSQCGFKDNFPLVCCPAQSKPIESGNRTCSTPDGAKGKCISIYSCPHILNLLKPPVPEYNVAYVRKSRCTGPDEYSVCCGPSSSFTVPGYTAPCQAHMSAIPPDPQTRCCGIESAADTHIFGFGGIETQIDQHPWAVIIEHLTEKNTTKLMCGGALISGIYVLTAGHCIAGQILKIATPHAVRLGEYDILHDGPDCKIVESGEDCTDGVKLILIEKTIPHPEYDPTDPRRRNDIGLIRLRETAPYTDFIRPICLPNIDLTLKQNVPDLFQMYAVGWGATSLTQPFSPVKVHVKLPFVDKEKCQKAYHSDDRNVDLWKGQLCAGGIEGKDSCKGDSGGPLVYENQQRFEVTGIVSFGPSPCGLDNVPGIYTNVYEYLEWINSIIVL